MLCRRDPSSTAARPLPYVAERGRARLCKTLQALAIRLRHGDHPLRDLGADHNRGTAMTIRPVQSGAVTTRLADIAAQAGVSEATVSRVLNGKPGVAATTRQSVLAALDVL